MRLRNIILIDLFWKVALNVPVLMVTYVMLSMSGPSGCSVDESF